MWFLSDEQPEYFLSNIEAQNDYQKGKIIMGALVKSLAGMFFVLIAYVVYEFYPLRNETGSNLKKFIKPWDEIKVDLDQWDERRNRLSRYSIQGNDLRKYKQNIGFQAEVHDQYTYKQMRKSSTVFNEIQSFLKNAENEIEKKSAH